LLFLCSGNAARSVMAGSMARSLLTGWRITTAGTHVIEGQPISRRTRDAMARLGFDANGHRSHQVTLTDLALADLVVGFAPEHVSYVRRSHPPAAGRTATLKRLCRDLPATTGSLVERLGPLDLAVVHLEPWEEVLDPAGGDLADFETCAGEVLQLTTALARILTEKPAPGP
jgi:protein-tyrosine-phosphatase